MTARAILAATLLVVVGIIFARYGIPALEVVGP